jgi:hypothetical protein
MGSAWPYLKASLTPLFQELRQRLPGFSILENNPGHRRAEALAKQAVETISQDSHLKNIIINGFANLKEGQREILKQLGNIENILARQNKRMSDFETQENDKLEEIITLLKELRRQPSDSHYTSGISMYDLEGTWTMVKMDPQDCAFKKGDYGLIIQPLNAFEARTGYTLILPKTNLSFLEGFEDDKGEYCQKIVLGINNNKKVRLYGTMLAIDFFGRYAMSREIEKITGNQIIMSWISGTKGIKFRWIFEK